MTHPKTTLLDLIGYAVSFLAAVFLFMVAV